MGDRYTYSIAMCNYNMAGTIEESLRSILDNVTDEYEVVVVDESTDDSRRVVRELQKSYDNLRLVELEPDPSRPLGRMRNIAVREADGEFVLTYMDADDRYECGITDFAEIYTQLRNQLGKDFYLSGGNINISSREFLRTTGQHRDLPISAAEEDFRIRMLARGDIINLRHEPLAEEIAPPERKESKLYSLRRLFRATVSRFQMGISFPSLFRNKVIQGENINLVGQLSYLFVLPTAYLVALTREQYDIPDEFRDWTERHRQWSSITYTLEELEPECDVTIDRDELSECGKDKFLS